MNSQVLEWILVMKLKLIQVTLKKRGTHRICNLNKLEVCLNDKLSCKYHVNDVVEDFIQHCYSLDNKIYAKLVGAYSKYKHIEKRHNKNNRKISWNCY